MGNQSHSKNYKFAAVYSVSMRHSLIASKHSVFVKNMKPQESAWLAFIYLFIYL